MTRTQFTWLAYLMLGFFAYMQASLGPTIPFLQKELSLNYTVVGLHSSAFAFGMILAGTSGEQVAKRLNRKNLFWLGGLGMSLGGVILTLGRTAIVTILAAFMMGFIGTYLLVMVQALLSDEFGEHRAIALTESNIVASIFAALAPLIVGLSSSIGIGWRLALWLGGIFWVLAYLSQRNIAFPQGKNGVSNLGDDKPISEFPRIYWLYWFIVFICVAIEWCMIFWSAAFLLTVVGLQADMASSLVSVLLTAMIIGRIVGSRLTRRFSTIFLLLIMTIIVLIGFPIFWLSNNLIWNTIGLIIVGLGLANLFPLGLSAASDIGSVNVDKASSRISQAAGLAILIVPQTLGTLADSWGIFRAYAILPILLIILISMIVFAFYLDRSKIL